MSNTSWFQLGYGTYKLEHFIAENLAVSDRHSLHEALHIVKDIKNKVENRSITLQEGFTLWNKAFDLSKVVLNSDDDSNDSM
jgi:hypothetical protein